MSQKVVTVSGEGVAGLQKKKMNMWSIAFIIYCMTAAGAFGIEAMIPNCGPGMTLLILAVLPIIWVIPICLAVSELSAFMPEESGMYVWTKEAFGEAWGFCMGWWGSLSVYLGMASYVVLVVGYVGKFMELSPTMAMCIKVGMILIFTIINLLGIKEVGIVSTIFSIVILAAFALVTVVGFANWNYNPVTPFIPEGQGVFDSLGLGICIGIWMYCGYAVISNMAGEIENPKVIPKAFKAIIPIIALSYILPTIAGLASVGNWQMWGIDTGEGGLDYASVLTLNLGKGWGIVFLICAIIAQCAIFNSYIAAGSRAFFVLGDDKLSPKFLTKLSKNRKIPYWPILILAAFTMLLMNLDFSVLLTVIAPLGIVCYIVLSFVFIKLRKKYPVNERGDVYYAKGGKLTEAYIVICPIIVGILALFVNGTEYFLIGFVSILSGVVAYIIFKIIFGGLTKIDPVKYPLNEKTRLAKGDGVRIGIFLMLFGVLLLAGGFFLAWYEGGWGVDYYEYIYKSGFMSDFWLMINTSKIGGAVMTAAGAALYLLGKKFDPVK
ncbi:MAG: APC family permease [Clostridiales bacterium]|nr:APC family permease [Clostridiales bacterium]